MSAVVPPVLGSLNPPTDAPKDSPNANEQSPYGSNNEKLEEMRPDLVEAIRTMVTEYRAEGIVSRRHEIRRIRQARMFWQGLHYAWWNDQQGMWVVPFTARTFDDKDQEEQPRFMYVTNIYLAFGLTFVAVLSATVPNVRTRPAKASKIEDVRAAEAATNVINLIEENNNPVEMLEDTGYYLFTDGKIGGYVRFVSDAERFGSTQQPIITQQYVPMGEDQYACPACKQYQFPYLQWAMEVHRAQLKAAFPHVEDKIQMGGSQNADEVYARTSRLTVAQGLPAVVPGDTLYDLVTYSQTWIRPRSFYRLDDKAKREELLKLFPRGCYVAFAGETYCISRDEKMDDKWRVMHAYPGDGQNRPSVGDPIIEVNQRVNTLSNLAMEMYEEDLGENFFDPEVLNADAISDRTVEPGSWTPAKPRPGTQLAAAFHKTQSGDVPASLPQYAEELTGEISQFLTGLFPAVFGGEAKGAGGDTAKGYELSRDQAMGRIGLVYRRLKEFYAEMMMLGVKCFAENRPEDVEISVEGIDGKDEADWIRLDDLQGNVKVVPEGDENFPLMTSQMRATFEKMFAIFGKDPAFMEMMDLPANMELAKTVFGMPDLELPGVDAAQVQKGETKQLLQSPPQMLPGPDGAPMPKSTVPVDPLLDNHQAHMAEIQRLHDSAEGQKIKRTNPPGFANLRAHFAEHDQALQQKQMAAAMMAAANAPKEAPNGKQS